MHAVSRYLALWQWMNDKWLYFKSNQRVRAYDLQLQDRNPIWQGLMVESNHGWWLTCSHKFYTTDFCRPWCHLRLRVSLSCAAGFVRGWIWNSASFVLVGTMDGQCRRTREQLQQDARWPGQKDPNRMSAKLGYNIPITHRGKKELMKWGNKHSITPFRFMPFTISVHYCAITNISISANGEHQEITQLTSKSIPICIYSPSPKLSSILLPGAGRILKREMSCYKLVGLKDSKWWTVGAWPLLLGPNVCSTDE